LKVTAFIVLAFSLTTNQNCTAQTTSDIIGYYKFKELTYAWKPEAEEFFNYNYKSFYFKLLNDGSAKIKHHRKQQSAHWTYDETSKELVIITNQSNFKLAFIVLNCNDKTIELKPTVLRSQELEFDKLHMLFKRLKK